MLSGRVSAKLCETFHLYVTEQSKVLRLLLMLANRLARADNAFLVTTDDSNDHKVGFYARKQLLLSARLSHRNSVCLSVCPSVRLSVYRSVTRVDQAKTVHARITKSSPSAAWKTLVLGTVELFHKFEGGHPERGR